MVCEKDTGYQYVVQFIRVQHCRYKNEVQEHTPDGYRNDLRHHGPLSLSQYVYTKAVIIGKEKDSPHSSRNAA